MPLEVKAEHEQEQLLLLEPQEFLQGAVQLTQVLGESPIFIWGGLVPRSGMGWSLSRIMKVLRVRDGNLLSALDIRALKSLWEN